MINIRDYFAAHADVSWIRNANSQGNQTGALEASRRTGVVIPSAPATDEEWSEFWIRVEVVWRWKFADYMLQGTENFELR